MALIDMWKAPASVRPVYDFGGSAEGDGHAAVHAGPVRRSLLDRPLDQLILSWVCLFPLWLIAVWVSGLTLFAVLMMAGFSLFLFSGLTRLEVATVATALLLLLGIGLAMIWGNPGDRAISSIYHIIHWIFLISFMRLGLVLMRSPDRSRWLAKLSVASVISLVIMAIYMVVMAWIISADPVNYRFPSLVIGRLAPDLEFFSGYSNIAVTKINPGGELRLIGFGLWTSEGAYLAVAIGLFAMMAAYRYLGFAGIVLVEVIIVLVLGLTGSRMTIAAFLLSMGGWLLFFAPYWRQLLVGLSPLLLGIVAFLVFDGINLIVDAWHQANEFRQASSGTRFTSYVTAWQLTMEQNPLTGLGYTPEMPELIHVPVGSHSSWTSILIRGGFLAVIGFAWMYWLLIKRLFGAVVMTLGRMKTGDVEACILSILLMRGVLVTLLWWVTEDLDGPAAGVAFAGLVIGLFWGLGERGETTGRVAKGNLSWR